MNIREAAPADLDAVYAVERAAFGGDEEADLVAALMDDPTAEPRVSLLAFEGGRAVGHVLLTAARLDGPGVPPGLPPVALLAPLAVVPDRQGRGIGGALVAAGLAALEAAGCGLVFVLGDPGYYVRHGFEPAGRLGFAAPYPIPDAAADAWMVRALRPGIVGGVHGTVRCAEALDRPEYWRE